MSTTQKISEQQAGSSVSDRVTDAVQQTKNKISDFGAAASDRVDHNRAAAASGIEGAAETLHQKADQLPGGQKVSNLAHSAADKMSATADYVREHDVSSMMNDIEDLVKKNPGPSLLCAAALGFLVGRTFSDSRG